jgi:arginine/lysine/ornithine decarboxylase
MALTHEQAPLVEALEAYLGESWSSFGVPGHKGGESRLAHRMDHDCSIINLLHGVSRRDDRG